MSKTDTFFFCLHSFVHNTAFILRDILHIHAEIPHIRGPDIQSPTSECTVDDHEPEKGSADDPTHCTSSS